MSPITENATVSLLPGTDVTSGDGAKIINSTLDTIASQPGFQRLFWGTHLEKPNVVQLLIDWNSIDDHKKFMASESYKPFVETMKPVLESPPKLQHVQFAGSLAPVVSAPITEVSTFFFPADISEHDRAAFEDIFSDCAVTLSKNADGNHGVRGGWSVDEVEHLELEGPGRAFVALYGWESTDAHKQYRETRQFKENLESLEEAAKAIEWHHVALKAH